MKNPDKIVDRYLATFPARREAEMEQGIAEARRMSTEFSKSSLSSLSSEDSE